MTKTEKFAREVAAVELLVYDELREEIHELGKERYCESMRATDTVIEEKRDAAYEKFHSEHPEYSYRAFNKVFFFMIDEGFEMAQEQELQF